MIRLLATASAAALVLTAAVVGFDGGATAGTATIDRPAPVQTASMDAPQAPAERKAEVVTATPAGCAKTVRVVGVGYGEPVINTCRTATPAPQPVRQ
ncbi:hypothetical protein [uncultured Alsobacter sp.]|uniref:hypothetical protein n=1 Tax=uncultured Alsobacter sp. TaxID=1748258 RepID=UPI0025E5588C|nr:hypothetical protein [uncultured Alsobacter sp.]